MHRAELHVYVLIVVSLLCTFLVIDMEIALIPAMALHDYNARSDKELTFKRGDLLQVIEKTSDGNWWDGFIGRKHGYIPVAYVEIIELSPDHNSKIACTKSCIPYLL